MERTGSIVATCWRQLLRPPAPSCRFRFRDPRESRRAECFQGRLSPFRPRQGRLCDGQHPQPLRRHGRSGQGDDRACRPRPGAQGVPYGVGQSRHDQANRRNVEVRTAAQCLHQHDAGTERHAQAAVARLSSWPTRAASCASPNCRRRATSTCGRSGGICYRSHTSGLSHRLIILSSSAKADDPVIIEPH